MEDIQSSIDTRGIAIQRVGINDVMLPFSIRTIDGAFQEVQARVRFTVTLPKEYKGTHMSRFIEILNKCGQRPLAEREMESIIDEAMERLGAESAELLIKFTYFVKKSAPVSGKQSFMDIPSCFYGTKGRGKPFVFELGVEVPYTSLCPCSKAISRYGAHNQRGVMRSRVRFASGYECIYIEDLVARMEEQASSPVYPLLKREDEKYVTEYAYEHPKFVEDVLRDLVIMLRRVEGLDWFSVSCENFESIHNHNAYASHEEQLTR